MNQIPKEWLDFLREQFPEGSRIKLRKMKDDPSPVKPGSIGTLSHIDDTGTFHVKWDDGRDVGLILGAGSFSALPPPLQTLKLYMPMTAGYFEDGCEDEIIMSPREAAEYAPQIIAALQSERRRLENEGPEEAERGLMAYFSGPDSVDLKVQSYHFTAEVRDGCLWGVAECKVRGSLTPMELQHLIDEIGGQASDGVGESFEQREIRADGGLELYAHLWQNTGWSIMTEQDRFDPHFSERLPDLCFSVLPEDGSLICITRGVGYQVSEDSCETPSWNRHKADYFNRERGITKAQEQAMLGGCLHGWDSPAAIPKTYEDFGTPAGAQHSGSGGERRSSEVSEPCPQDRARDTELVTTRGGLTLGQRVRALSGQRGSAGERRLCGAVPPGHALPDAGGPGPDPAGRGGDTALGGHRVPSI